MNDTELMDRKTDTRRALAKLWPDMDEFEITIRCGEGNEVKFDGFHKRMTFEREIPEVAA